MQSRLSFAVLGSDLISDTFNVHTVFGKIAWGIGAWVVKLAWNKAKSTSPGFNLKEKR
jgi:hypothetical protein